MSLYQEVRLYTNASQREAFDNRAELYSIIKTIQELEVNCPEFTFRWVLAQNFWVNSGDILRFFIQKAYIKDAVPAETYTKACSKLLTQYKAALRVAEVSDGKLKSNFIKMPSIF